MHPLCHFIVYLKLLLKRYHSRPILSPLSSIPSSAASSLSLVDHFVQICALMIASTRATTGATQVQPQINPLVHLYGDR